MSLAASIDVGSNTLRLLIARINDGRVLEPVLVERRITRLSQNLEPGGGLFPPAKQRTLSALAEFKEILDRNGVERLFGGATAAVRLAADGDRFLGQIYEKTGLRVRKLSGGEEARLTALGVMSGLTGASGPVLVVDPGGQSTEIIPVDDGSPGSGLSLDLGVVALTERFISTDPPDQAQIDGLDREIRRRVAGFTDFYPSRPDLTLAGTAGTVTTIAAMLLEMETYEPERITGRKIGLRETDELARKVGPLTLEERRSLPGLEPGREDVILAGLLLVRNLIQAYDLKEMTVIDSGLLEGLILDGLGIQPAARKGD